MNYSTINLVGLEATLIRKEIFKKIKPSPNND